MNSKKMRVVEITTPGGPEVLTLSEQEIPRPGYGEVLIELAYAGVNRPDLLQRAGRYAPPPGASPIPGLEGSGRIAALGPGVTDWALGDQVCALLPGGGYGEFAVCSARHCLPVPAALTLKEAACLPETFFTVWTNLFVRNQLRAGELLCVHGGSSGIGTTAIQLANLFGSRVFTTAGSDEKCAACEALGAERSINYRKEDFVEILRSEGGADVILDMVGGEYIPRNIKALKDEGRLVQIAFLTGAKQELNFAQIMTRRLTVTGSTLRPQSELAKSKIADSLRKTVWPYLEVGRVRPILFETFSIEDVSEAHRLMESSEHIGKIVLKIQ